jgi:O-antigen ligase
MFQVSVDWVLVKTLILFCFVITLIMHRPLQWSIHHWLLVMLLPLIALSGFVNGSGAIGIDEAQKLIAAAIIPFFLFTSCVSSAKRQRYLMVLCIISVLCMIHNGHYQQTSEFNLGWALNTQGMEANDRETTVSRMTYLGFFGDPNDIGLFLVMCIPFLAYFFTQGKFLTKLTTLTILSIFIYGIYITGSRGTQLGALSLIPIYYLVLHAGPKIMITAVSLAPIAAVLLTSLTKNIDESANGRLEAWYAGIQMMLSHPITGIGKGNFADHHGLTAHNSYILILGELGIPGYTLWGGVLISIVLTGYLFIKNSQRINSTELTDEQKSELKLNKTLFFSMIGFLVTAFFLSRSYTVVLFVFLGITLASHIRLSKLMPELAMQCFNTSVVLRSMMYCWAIIVAVYIALKVGL